jgi:hypothetical protein
MSSHPLFKAVALLNFVAGLTLLVWLSCAPQTTPPPRAEADAAPPTVAAVDPAPSPAPNAAPPRIASLDAVVDCLTGGGGVVDGACVTPAKVDGVRLVDVNDHYFSASKAAPVFTPDRPRDVVQGLAHRCRQQPQAQQAAAPSPPSDDDVLPCVLAELAARTRLE